MSAEDVRIITDAARRRMNERFARRAAETVVRIKTGQNAAIVQSAMKRI